MARPLSHALPTQRRSTAGRPAPRVNGGLWRQLVAASAPASAGELAAAIGTSIQTADHRLKLWVRAGLVERIAGRPQRYRFDPAKEPSSMPPAIAADGRAKPPVPTAAERLWRAIRTLKRFDLPALRLTAGASERTTLGYVGLLQRTGYVRLDKLGNPRTGICSRYVLVRNTGRHAPRETIVVEGGERRRLLVDANTGERHDVGRGAPSHRRSYRTDPVADGGVG